MERSTYWLCFALVLALAAFNLFWSLGSVPVSDWDEARHGVTAYEMLRSGNWVVSTYAERPDYWNLKPPIGHWMTASSFSAFGYTNFSLRFFSALLSWLTVILTMLIADRVSGKAAALLSGLVLATLYGFVLVHSGRAGDYDAAFTFFAILSFYLVIRGSDHPLFFCLAGLPAALAFLTKSFAVIAVIAVIGLFVLLGRKQSRLLFRHYLGFAFLFLLPLFAWGIARYHHDGLLFLKAMVWYDLIRRSSQGVEGNVGNHFFYIETFVEGTAWWLYSSGGLLLLLLMPRIAPVKDQPKINEHTAYPLLLVLIWLILPMILFSVAKTKLPWYINLVYPAAAIFCAFSIQAVFSSNSFHRGTWNSLRKGIVVLVCLAASVGAELQIIKAVAKQVRTTDKAQEVLLKLPAGPQPEQRTLFLACEPRQSLIMIAAAQKHLILDTLTGPEFDEAVRETPEWNLVAVEMKVRERLALGKERLLTHGRPGDLIMLSNTEENRQYLETYRLSAVAMNEAWLIAEKRG
ncbi:MAG: phospholipid carrier-dependent glycosyltransferase [Nitrospirae bacterium]|nr:MAG: phospholipid carrier-dependent glycosyltransferase [Nitrospirota bacterium]